jgi:hypothetical protein
MRTPFHLRTFQEPGEIEFIDHKRDIRLELDASSKSQAAAPTEFTAALNGRARGA